MKVREVQVPRGAAGAAIGLIVGGGIDNNAATGDYPPPPSTPPTNTQQPSDWQPPFALYSILISTPLPYYLCSII